MTKYYISDHHFFHRGALMLDKRPFESIQAMNDIMIERHNQTVSGEDDIYFLGDVFSGGTEDEQRRVLSQLKGRKHLYIGNHDKKLLKSPVISLFKSVQHYKPITDHINGFTKHIIPFHYPIPVFNGHFKPDVYHFYGHVHETPEEDFTLIACALNRLNPKDQGQMLNVGAMLPYMDYTPRRLEELDVFIQQRLETLNELSLKLQGVVDHVYRNPES